MDRLCNSPYKGEAGEPRPDSREALEAAIQRDLTALLNTRREQETFPPEFQESIKSLLTFGVPDLNAMNLRLVSEQNRLRRIIEAAIQIFEPRLSNVKVRVEHWDEAKPLLRFEIVAYLHGDPILFDTFLKSDSGEFFVRRQA